MKAKPTEEKIEYQIEKFRNQQNEFTDTRIHELCNDYLNQIVDDKTHTPSTKVALCRDNIVLFEKFKNICIGELSWIAICHIAKDCSVTLNRFNKFVVFLYEKRFIQNDISNEILYYMKSHRYNSSLKYLYSTDVSKLFVFDNTNNYIDIVLINANEFVRELLTEFILESPSVRGIPASKAFFELFEDSFTDIKYVKSICSIEYFTCSTFEQQFSYYNKLERQFPIRVLINFYLFLYGKYTKLFKITDELDIFILQRPNFIIEYIKGARKVLLNPFEEIPLSDIWYLDYNGMNYSSNKYSDEFIKIVDFTIIPNNLYRKFAKEYFWKSIDSIVVKLQRHHFIKPFFNYISDIKSGKELSIYVKFNSHIDYTKITMNEIMAYKTFSDNKQQSDNTFNTSILSVKNVLEYLCQNNLLQIEQGVLNYLKSKQVRESNNAHPIPDDELLKLAELMRTKAETSYDNKLNYLIFYIILETEFRISHILSLKTNCYTEASKPNEYVIKSIDKTSDGNIVDHPITIYTKNHIDDLLKISQDIRNDCKNPNLNKYLFLSKSIRMNNYTKHSQEQFNDYLKGCCKELGLPKYTSSNLRDTHITKAQEYILRNNKSDMEQSVLTGHKNPNSDNHYIESKITDMLETVYLTIIGDIELKGQVVDNLSTDLANEEHSVSNKCGYCGRDSCDDYSYLDCLMCQSFIATIDRIAYFEEQIRVINAKIKTTSLKHDKEDLLNIKQLLLNYLKRLLVRRELLNI